MRQSTALFGLATLVTSALAMAQAPAPAQPQPVAAPAQPQPVAAPAQPQPVAAPAQPQPVAAPAQPQPVAPNNAGTPPVVQYQNPQAAPPPQQNYAYGQQNYAYGQPNAIYEPPPPPARPGDRLHDGFYLRLAIGGGYLSNTIAEKLSNGSQAEMKVTGGALALEVLVGGAVIPGLVLGGGLWADPMLSPKVEIDGVSAPIGDNYNVQLSRIGIFVDIYPEPKGGFHLQGNAAYAAFSVSERNSSEALANAKGLGLGAAAGYEWWIGREWGVGVMGRFTYASLSADGESHTIIYPSILSSFTFN